MSSIIFNKARLSVFILTTIFLFSSSLSGCRKVPPGLVDEAGHVVNQLGKKALRSEVGTAVGIGINNLEEVKAAQQLNEQAQQIYAEMVTTSGYKSLAQARDAVQKAADKQNMVISSATVSSIAVSLFEFSPSVGE